jgi:hypothetical protein
MRNGGCKRAATEGFGGHGIDRRGGVDIYSRLYSSGGGRRWKEGVEPYVLLIFSTSRFDGITLAGGVTENRTTLFASPLRDERLHRRGGNMVEEAEESNRTILTPPLASSFF